MRSSSAIVRYLVALAAGLERGVADDAAQPEPETGGLAQLAQVLVGDQKRLLHHVASQLEVGEGWLSTPCFSFSTLDTWVVDPKTLRATAENISGVKASVRSV